MGGPLPNAGAILIDFQTAAPLSSARAAQLARRLVAELPLAPDEVEVQPAGGGWVKYLERDELTLDDLTQAVQWLSAQADITDVRWTTVIDL